MSRFGVLGDLHVQQCQVAEAAPLRHSPDQVALRSLPPRRPRVLWAWRRPSFPTPFLAQNLLTPGRRVIRLPRRLPGLASGSLGLPPFADNPGDPGEDGQQEEYRPQRLRILRG